MMQEMTISVESLVGNTNQLIDLTLYTNALHGKWATDFNYSKQNRKSVIEFFCQSLSKALTSLYIHEYNLVHIIKYFTSAHT